MPAEGLLDRINNRVASRETKTWSQPPFWALEQARYAMYGGLTNNHERIENDYEGYATGAFKGNSVIWSCINRRQQVFSQARFQWRQFVKGRPGDLFGSAELALLEQPWVNGTTGELLTLMELDASIGGNSYWTTVSDDGTIGRASAGRPGRRVMRMRPDWTTIVIDGPSGDPFALDARIVAFLFEPRTFFAGARHEPVTLLPEETVHYSPYPDPVARFRGMSWITPVLKEIESDIAASVHKLKFFQNGATPSIAVKGIKAATKGQFDDIVNMMESRHAGANNAYRTLYLVDGVDATAIGANLDQVDFREVMAGGETRVASAAGVPAVILGNFDGLRGSSLNTGNFESARRLFVDGTIRDLWAKAAASLARLVTPPMTGATLWYDARDIPFLHDDAKDDASIKYQNAQTLSLLVSAGWEPDACVIYMSAGDPSALTGKHTGLYSVQLQPPNPGTPADNEPGVPTPMPDQQPPPPAPTQQPPPAPANGGTTP